jgi:hypothetical protein
MEITILLMLFSFSLLMIYLAFTKEYDIRGISFALTFFAGLGLIATGFYLHNRVVYVGWVSMNVDPYTITADSVNGLGHWVVAVLFELTGFLVWVVGILIELFSAGSVKQAVSMAQLSPNHRGGIK